MPTKKTYQLGTAFESKFGFARAVRKAHLIFVSGTTALKLSEDGDESDGSGVHHRDDAGKQASLSMQRCVDGVKALGGEREDITRVRMFVRNFEDGDAVGAAYKEEFVTKCREGEAGSAATMITGAAFVAHDILVEVEVDAVLDI